jgi:hypothetical protein
MKEDWSNLFFLPLPDTVSGCRHLIAADRFGSLLLPKVALCWHRKNKWPRGLKKLRPGVRSAGFRCEHCRSTVLSHPLGVLKGQVYCCKCMLYSVADRLRQPDTAAVWQRLQAIYQLAQAHAEEFAVPPTSFNGLN